MRNFCFLLFPFFLFKSLGIGLAHVKENNNKQKCENILLKYLVVFCQIVLIFFFFVLISVGFSHIFFFSFWIGNFAQMRSGGIWFVTSNAFYTFWQILFRIYLNWYLDSLLLGMCCFLFHFDSCFWYSDSCEIGFDVVEWLGLFY